MGMTNRAGRRPSGSEASATQSGTSGRAPAGRRPQSSIREGIGSEEFTGTWGDWEHAPPAHGDWRRGCCGSPESGAAGRELARRVTWDACIERLLAA